MGSANGTFLNSKRLSEEGQESSPIEVKDNDVVCFGIDIVEDGKLLYEKVNFTVKFNNEPVPVTILESRGASLEKSASIKQQKVKSASIKNEKPELPAKPIDNLVQAVQQSVQKVQEQTNEISKIQTQLQSINDPKIDSKIDSKIVELQIQHQNDLAIYNKRISNLEQTTVKLNSVVDQLLSKLASDSEIRKQEQLQLQSQFSTLQKTNQELLQKLKVSGNDVKSNRVLTAYLDRWETLDTSAFKYHNCNRSLFCHSN
eukprot:NODE_44_length_33449_cov_1.575742.p20 type:complete len:258 gc:universal NODE_44_length_33449_cov_1.575742:14741-15514(+)